MEDGVKSFYDTLDKDKFKFFRNNDVYTVFDADIDKIPNHNSRDVVERRGMRELRLPQTGIEEIIRIMLIQKKVVVQEYENMTLTREGYPGHWKDFTDLLLGKRPVPSILAVKLSKAFEVSFIKTSESVVQTCSFEDDDMFSNLYGIINETNALEVIYDNRKLNDFLNGIGVSNHFRRDRGSSTKLLCEYLRVDEEQYEHREYIRPFICRVDGNVLSALNVCDEDKHCVIKTFSCYTNQGWRLLSNFFMQPLRNKKEIERRLDIVDEFRSLNLGILNEFPDLLKLTRRISSSRISIQETLRLLQVIDNVPKLMSILESRASLIEDFVLPLKDLYLSLQTLKAEVERVIDMEAAENKIYRVRLDVSERLYELDGKLTEVEGNIQKEYERVCKIYAKTKLDASSGVFKVTKVEYQRNQDLFNEQRFLVLNFSKAGVSFSTRNLSLLNAQKESIGMEIEKEERCVVNGMRGMLKRHLPSIELLNYITALADVFNAFSVKAMLKGYSRPFFSEKTFEIRNGFHPVLEDRSYIPNSVRMDNKRMCVITGPNMGGKSTFLKTCGVIAILAQIGSYVPAERSTMPIFDGIYVRVGANDCAFTGASTFMMEMIDVARICRLSSSESLVIIDELGRGTSAIDGLSIARAVKEHLVMKNVLCFCATHFPELCSEDVLNKRVKSNGSVLMYELIDGVCDTSFGISVAEKVNFPKEVVEVAKKYMAQ